MYGEPRQSQARLSFDMIDLKTIIFRSRLVFPSANHSRHISVRWTRYTRKCWNIYLFRVYWSRISIATSMGNRIYQIFLSEALRCVQHPWCSIFRTTQAALYLIFLLNGLVILFPLVFFKFLIVKFMTTSALNSHTNRCTCPVFIFLKNASSTDNIYIRRTEHVHSRVHFHNPTNTNFTYLI